MNSGAHRSGGEGKSSDGKPTLKKFRCPHCRRWNHSASGRPEKCESCHLPLARGRADEPSWAWPGSR